MDNEEDAFWSLVFIMMDRGWREIFRPKSNKIARLLHELEEHIAMKLPRLYDHFL